MSKRADTVAIEERLYHMVQKKRIYGCSEVTIGFYRNGHGNEIVDFCTMDSKGIVRCYEIKVTLSDFKSKAKKSWYGHYNYLVVSEELLSVLTEELLDKYIPKCVGLAIPCFDSWSDGIKIIRNAKRQMLTIEDEVMVKESLVRTLSYKLNTVRDSNNLEKMSELKRNISKQERELDTLRKEYCDLQFNVQKLENYLLYYYGKEFTVETFQKDYGKREKELPKTITLNLTPRGEKYNLQVLKNLEIMHEFKDSEKEV